MLCFYKRLPRQFIDETHTPLLVVYTLSVLPILFIDVEAHGTLPRVSRVSPSFGTLSTGEPGLIVRQLCGLFRWIAEYYRLAC